jgi:hypothetical protein
MITFQRLGQLGQLGNQMFQYATLLAGALAKGYTFGVPYGNRSPHRRSPSARWPSAVSGMATSRCPPFLRLVSGQGPVQAPQ